MTATLMDGRALSSKMAEKITADVSRMKAQGKEPTLATILVGDDPSSKVYLGSKHKAAQKTGIASQSHSLPADASEEELVSLIEGLNRDRRVDGILLQLPLPHQFSERKMIERISPEKDVDGLTSTNTGRLFYGQSDLVPCTPKGVMELLHHYKVPIASSSVVIVNRSPLVGKPLYHLLLTEDATVTMCHSKSTDLASTTRRADIVITAVGRRPGFVLTGPMVKDGAVVIDVAMNRVDGKLVGDADFEAVSKKASFITPVPGGVGPMTVIMLMQNTLIAASRQSGLLLSSVVQG
ncbi:MAG: bifunctional 5,10-methylenetetrahydrofolate dehydrogenase/5,10-methenyltetrahydrofolate cyclohydrolase [Thaumarchaeota archaeon]|nr:bifunctional 5,10-methylenetetrahydrofolate dehydrogenase/5,10-methenyltetrahydrofolate cyclohydrolase [Nitrososphaerota archaeon]